PSARRIELVRLAAALAKTYVGSETFRTRYAKELADAPAGRKPPAPAQTFAAYVKQSQSAVEQNIAQLKKEPGIPADQRAELEESMRVQLKQITGATARQRTAWEAEERERFARESEAYKRALADGRALPQDATALVRLRLRQFLAETAGIDFAAQ